MFVWAKSGHNADAPFLYPTLLGLRLVIRYVRVGVM
jgi:hypothetical protein